MSVFELKVIPQLDQMPWAVQLAKTFVGKLLMLALLALGLKTLGTSHVLIVTLCVVFPVFMPDRRLICIYILNVFCWIFWASGFFSTRSLYDGNVIAKVAYLRGIDIPWFGLGINVVVVISAFFVFLALMKLFARFEASLGHKTITILGVFTGLLFVTDTFNASGLPFLFLFGLTLFIANSAFYFLYSESLDDASDVKSASMKFFSFVPFWFLLSSQSGPIPIGHQALTLRAAKNPDELAILQLKALKLLLLYAIVKMTGQLFSQALIELPADRGLPIALPSLKIANFMMLGFERFNQLGLPWYQVWVSSFAIMINVVTSQIVGEVGALVVVVRFCGIYVPRPVYRIFESRSFADFFRRLMYYYNQMIVRFFLLPIADLSRDWPVGRKTRQFLVTFIAVFSGAFCIHLLRDVWIIPELGFSDWLVTQALRSPYYFGLALFCALSTFRLRASSVLGSGSILWRPIQMLMYALIYTLCLNLTFQYDRSSVIDRVRFILSMFGL